MRGFKIPGQSDQRAPAGMLPSERRKIIAMGIGVLLVFGALIWGRMKAAESSKPEGLDDVPELAGPVRIDLPEIDGAAVDALVHDSERLDRVVLEPEALDLLMDDARNLTARHFEALETPELDAAGIATIVADPSAHRGRPFFARGLVDSLRTRQRGNEVEHIGRLRLDDDSFCYFLVLDAPENGGYVRVDGLFFKVFSDENEIEPGEWIDGPLLLGPKAQRSYRAIGEITELRPDLFEEVEDAAFFDPDGNLLPEEERLLIQDAPFDALWNLMAYARDLTEDEIDWDAAPELTNEVLRSWMLQPGASRLQPVRIPICRVQDGRVVRPGENPARIETITQGWLGHNDWRNVVRFLSPTPDDSVEIADYAYGKGFFLHNFAYPSAAAGMRIAPLVVIPRVERYENEADPIWDKLALAFVGFTVLSILAFFLLLLRDKKRSRALQEDLVRRRRARRASNPAGA